MQRHPREIRPLDRESDSTTGRLSRTNLGSQGWTPRLPTSAISRTGADTAPVSVRSVTGPVDLYTHGIDLGAVFAKMNRTVFPIPDRPSMKRVGPRRWTRPAGASSPGSRSSGANMIRPPPPLDGPSHTHHDASSRFRVPCAQWRRNLRIPGIASRRGGHDRDAGRGAGEQRPSSSLVVASHGPGWSCHGGHRSPDDRTGYGCLPRRDAPGLGEVHRPARTLKSAAREAVRRAARNHASDPSLGPPDLG